MKQVVHKYNSLNEALYNLSISGGWARNSLGYIELSEEEIQKYSKVTYICPKVVKPDIGVKLECIDINDCYYSSSIIEEHYKIHFIFRNGEDDLPYIPVLVKVG